MAQCHDALQGILGDARHTPPATPAAHRMAGAAGGEETQYSYPRYAPTATFKQASRRLKGADPQQALL